MNRLFVGFSLILYGAVLLAPGSSAQGRGGTFFHPSGRTGGAFFNGPSANGFMRGLGAGRFRGRFARGGRHRYAIYPYDYYGYGPAFYSDNDYENGEVDEPAPPPRAAAAAKPAEPHKSADSVVMELRGDHWVRITSTGPVEVVGRSSADNAAAAGKSSTSANGAALPAFYNAPAAAPLPAAILVFRDGHLEEVSKYTIVGQTIFLKSDYWSTGSWTRKISTTALDIPATLKLNSDRGTKFALPSRPSEVILRP